MEVVDDGSVDEPDEPDELKAIEWALPWDEVREAPIDAIFVGFVDCEKRKKINGVEVLL